MQTLELKRTKLTVKLDGQAYELSVPNVSEVQGYTSRLKEAEEKGQEFNLMCDFLQERGLPSEVAKTLELSHVKLISDNLFGLKKN